jgi:hypothetical protein
MGLIGGMARTAVVAGTATAVSNRVSRRQARRWGGEQEYQQQNYPPQQDYQQQYYPPQQPAPAPQPAPTPAGAGDALTNELERLAGLHQQGILTDEEFAAAKSKLLGL